MRRGLFGVIIGFAISGAIYDTSSVTQNLSDWYGPENAELGFLFSAWHIPIVMVSYFIGTLLLRYESFLPSTLIDPCSHRLR
jgi:hypothetical protein